MHRIDDRGIKKGKRRSLLKEVKIGEVSFVGRGANPGALQSLFKTADVEQVAKRLFNEVVSDLEAGAEAEKLIGDMMSGVSCLKHSLIEIMEDPRTDQRKGMLRQSVQEFSSAMATMIDNAQLAKALLKAAGKTEQGKVFPAGDYAYVPDTEKPSTWKLRLTSEPGGEPDPRIVGMAVAALGEGFRGQKVNIPADDRAKVVARVKAAWLKANKNGGEKNLPAILKNSEEETMSKEALEKLQKTVDGLQAKLTKSEFFASLNDAQTAHYNGLDDDGKAAFEKMDDKARTAVVEETIAKKAADDETLEVDGNAIKKSEVGPGVFAFMKAQQAKTDAAVAKAEKLEAETVQKSLEAEAEKMFPNMVGTAADKAAILKGIRAMPKDQQDTQIKMLKAADAAMAKSFKELGQGGETEAGTAAEKLNKIATERAEKESISFEKAYSKVMETKEGAELYEETLKR